MIHASTASCSLSSLLPSRSAETGEGAGRRSRLGDVASEKFVPAGPTPPEPTGVGGRAGAGTLVAEATALVVPGSENGAATGGGVRAAGATGAVVADVPAGFSLSLAREARGCGCGLAGDGLGTFASRRLRADLGRNGGGGVFASFGTIAPDLFHPEDPHGGRTCTPVAGVLRCA